MVIAVGPPSNYANVAGNDENVRAACNTQLCYSEGSKNSLPNNHLETLFGSTTARAVNC